MRYLVGVFVAIATAITVGMSLGYLDATRAGDPVPPTRAAFHAHALSVGLNCSAALSLVLVPVSLGVAYWRRKKTRTGR